MRAFPRFARVPLAIVLTGFGAGLVLAAPAGAEVTSETAAACEAAFSGPTAAEVKLVTDPPARSDALPGQEVHLDASWAPGAWDALSSVTACVRVNRVVDTALSSSEAPTPDDGLYGHVFAVPEGLFNGTAICTRIRLAGDPIGDATEAVWVSKQACFEVHPEEATGPTTSPTTAPPVTPAQPPAEPAPTPTPAPTPAPPIPQSAPAPPPAGTVSSPDVSPLPRPAAPTAADGAAPGDGIAGGRDTPATRVPPSEDSSPIALPVLPATGTDPLASSRTGLLAVAAGVPLLLLGRRRWRRSPGPVC